MRSFYPPIEPFQTFRMQVSDIHEIHGEQCGNPDGKPIIFLHGGPGGGLDPNHRRYFHPEKWRVILFDQRGCGRSTPFGNLEQNTTPDLVSDMEAIRIKLGIDKWHVFGGSWGSTLALAYAVAHPERVCGLILRGIFLLRKKEIHWFYQHGASEIFPEEWDKFLAPIPEAERSDLLTAYHKRLNSQDSRILSEAAKAWSIWEGSTSKLLPDPNMVEHFGEDAFAYAFARIENHYFMNKGFFPEDNYLLNHCHRFAHIPGVIVQGRYDMPCPVRSAWDLHKLWKRSELKIIPDAGHSASEMGIIDALVQATDFFAL